MPRANGTADLIVNKQNGQWGTEYDGARDLGTVHLRTETTEAPVEKFTIAIVGLDARRGTLSIEWGPFRWTAPIVVGTGQKKGRTSNRDDGSDSTPVRELAASAPGALS